MENGAWAQTLFTITPEEDGYLREINEATRISGKENTDLNLAIENVIHRQSLVDVTRDFIDPRELEKTEFQESQCQTYMRGYPTVHYDISYRDEGSQTMYIGRNFPPPPGQLPKAVANILNKKTLPKLKKSQLSQTIVTVMEDLPETEVLMGLLQEITDEEQNDPDLMVNATVQESARIESHDVLNFIIDRTIWIADDEPEIPIVLKNVEVETSIKYNHYLKRFMHDSEIQTNLTLEPKKSSSKLLDDYFEIKTFAQTILLDLMDSALSHRILVDELIDEIVDKCSEFVHLPLKDETVQTLASGQPFGAKDEEVLQKLRRSIALESAEASSMSLLIVGDMLDKVVENVSQDADDAAKFVISKVARRSLAIVDELDKIQRSSKTLTKDQIFAIRKRKLALSMPKKKETEDASTQTGLAGVPELGKYQETKEVACCVCPTQSECRWCSIEEDEVPRKETKMLRTQDILLAYKPCYVMMNPAEATPDMRRPCLPENQENVVQGNVKREPPSRESSLYTQCPCAAENEEEEKEVKDEESTSGWSHVINTDAWTYPKLPSKESKSATSTQPSLTTCRSSKSQSPLPKTTVEALQILKSTFCDRTTCPGGNTVIENPKYMSSEISPKSSQKNRGISFCTNFDFPESDECVCEFFNKKIQEKLTILSNQLGVKTKQ